MASTRIKTGRFFLFSIEDFSPYDFKPYAFTVPTLVINQ